MEIGTKAFETLCWVIGVIVGTGLIEISPIKLNPWSWLLSPLRKAITGNIAEKVDKVDEKIDKVQKDLEDHVKESELENILNSRTRLLRFSDEIVLGQEHTKEHYDDILSLIDKYEKYCVDHPEFPNNKCIMAIENIKDGYKERLKNNSFVTIERLVINKKEK